MKRVGYPLELQQPSRVKPQTTKQREKDPVDVQAGVDFKSRVDKPFTCPPSFEPAPTLKRFDPLSEENQLPEHFFMILEGSRRIGKTEFLKWILYYYRDQFDLAIVLTETPHNGAWQPFVGNKWVHSGWNPFLINKLLVDQMKQCKKAQDSGDRYKPRRVLVILDDIIGDRNRIHADETLNRLAVQGRHFKISVALTTQDPKAIHPSLRNNCDVAVIFQQKNFRGKEAIYNDFINLFDKKLTAIQLMRTYTKEHDCIVCFNNKLAEIPEVLYFHCPGDMRWDKVKDKALVPDYQVGSQEQKRLAQTEAGQKPLYPGMR